MTDEEAMEALLNSDGYSFPTWTLTLGLPTYEMRDVMSLIASDKRPIPDDYGMDYAVLNYGINDVGIQDLKESGFKPVYSDNLTVCLKRSTV